MSGKSINFSILQPTISVYINRGFASQPKGNRNAHPPTQVNGRSEKHFLINCRRILGKNVIIVCNSNKAATLTHVSSVLQICVRCPKRVVVRIIIPLLSDGFI